MRSQGPTAASQGDGVDRGGGCLREEGCFYPCLRCAYGSHGLRSTPGCVSARFVYVVVREAEAWEAERLCARQLPRQLRSSPARVRERASAQPGLRELLSVDTTVQSAAMGRALRFG
jgi:hypothetical protein